MRKLGAVILLLCFLAGCSGEQEQLEGMLDLRQELLQKTCSFRAEVTADYGDKTYSFSMDCRADKTGELKFTVVEPETISGISGVIRKGEGALVFDNTALSFELLTDDLLSPVSAPWIMLKALRSGYILSGGIEGQQVHITLRDSYDSDALRVDVWLDENQNPVQGEILWKDRRILTISVKDFVIS